MASPTAGRSLAEKRVAFIHRVILPDVEYPKEYGVLVTDRRSIFIRQEKTRGSWVLRQEMRFGTALVTDVTPKTLEDYRETSLDALTNKAGNLSIPHTAVLAMTMATDQSNRRKRDFFVRMVMKGRRKYSKYSISR